ncbi:hypothetical protein N9164_03465 [Draconibacterium sp.]|nr:hypothetical protein [Draconibacterium sp.]
MTKSDLIELLDSWENLEITIKEIIKNPEYFGLLMSIALHNKNQKSWRAAYLADKIHDEFPELLIPFLPEIVAQLKVERSTSKKRHFLKLISMNEIVEDHFGFLIDYCLQALTSAKEPPAVRVHAMQILYNISETETDLKPEILAVIEHELEYHSTAGILSRGSKLAKRLRKQISDS